MEYEIVTGSTLTDFKENVNQKISEGWVPQGGLAIVWRDYGNDSYWNYNQAMVRMVEFPPHQNSGFDPRLSEQPKTY